MRQYLENGRRYSKVILITNRNIGIAALSTDTKINDLELLTVQICERIALDFADFGGNYS